MRRQIRRALDSVMVAVGILLTIFDCMRNVPCLAN
jgi:hypothetical protein